MSEFAAEDRLNKYAKESKKIQYSTKIFEETSKEREKPKIVLRELINDEQGKENHIWTIILKYTIEDISQEVILGTLGHTSERKEKAIQIINLIQGQLEENLTSEAGYNSYEKLSQYIHNENIPFQLTMEGIDILANKNHEKQLITRTCFENRQGKIESLFTKEDLDKMKSERKNELIEYINKKKQMQKWKERREKILNSFESEEKEKFLKGEKITEFIQETDEDIKTKQDIVADYLLEAFEEEKSDENPKYSLVKGYLKIKEKGIAIDIKRKLENLEKTYFKEIKEKKGEISLEEYKNIEIIEDYKNFFDLVKNGQDWNARLFALKLKKIDFNLLTNLVKAVDSKDEELLQYLDLKEKMVNELQTDSIDVDYEYDSVKEMYQFLLHSSIREKTKDDDEHVISGVYQHVKREIIESNIDKVELYNNYAQKSNMFVCEIPKVKKISEQRPISKVVKKICEELDLKIIQNSERQENSANPEKIDR